jgi:hypothetical protein
VVCASIVLEALCIMLWVFCSWNSRASFSICIQLRIVFKYH